MVPGPTYPSIKRLGSLSRLYLCAIPRALTNTLCPSMHSFFSRLDSCDQTSITLAFLYNNISTTKKLHQGTSQATFWI